MIDGAPVNVLDYGAVGDGTTDDTAAIQAAITSVSATGGTVYFPTGKYLVTAKITVSSLYPVSLIAEMKGQFYNPTSNAACILVGAAMDYVIEYSAPNPALRSNSGGGLVRGLSFVDPTAVNAGSPGTRTIQAALYLKDFSLSSVENCSFHWLKGSAIKAEFAVMTTVKGCVVRYCGDLSNPTRSAILLAGTSATYPVQSFTLDDTRVEVCYSTEYVTATTYCYDLTLRSCKFEAATTEYPNSAKQFLKLGATRFLIEGCAFNRTLVDAVETTLDGRGTFVGCTFATGTGSNANRAIKIASPDTIISSCIFEDTCTAYTIEITGTAANTIITGNKFYFSGGIYTVARGTQIIGNGFRDTTQTTGTYLYSIVLAGDAQIAALNRFDHTGTPGVGGIVVYGQSKVSGNQFDRYSARTCIRREVASAVIDGNQFVTVATAYSEVTAAGAGSSLTMNGSPTVPAPNNIQILTGAGAVNLTQPLTHIYTTGVNALTLADGVEGQRKTLVMAGDSGDGTLTPTNLAGAPTTITFKNVGDTAELLFTSGTWFMTGGSATVA